MKEPFDYSIVPYTFGYGFAVVSLYGNSSVLSGKRWYLQLETLVSMRGNCSFPPGNRSSDAGNERFNDRKINFDAWCATFLLTAVLQMFLSATYLQRYLQRYNCLSVSLLFRFCCRWQMFFYFSNFIVGKIRGNSGLRKRIF